MSQVVGPMVPLKRWDQPTQDADIVPRPRAIMIDTGVVVVWGEDDNPETLPLVAGVWHPMNVKRVVSSGTTATTVWVAW